ncbi:MAG: hypothetical protein A2017_21060 [Lentisphaerae bacterium GWF2_44_16]|nr:MAG: hypothetical protein A2017_21060 [Lentisphaerae bacterium GWF2_44_16]
MKKFFPFLFKLIFILFFILLSLWSFGAIWYSNLPEKWMRVTSAFLLPVLLLCLIISLRKRKKIRFAAISLVFIAIITWWSLIPASNNQDWLTQFSEMPRAVINGNNVSIENIRNFEYKTAGSFIPHYINGIYKLDELKNLDMAVSYWDGNTAIAHTMLSFGFSDGRHLVFSCETRMKKNQVQSGIPGLFKQYNILYIIGTEDDLFKLRTNYRKEELYLYPTNSTPEECVKIFLSLLNRCDELFLKPEFYNTLTFNCTTSLIPSIRQVTARHCDIRFCLNGYSDRMAWEFGWLKHMPGESFPDYKKKHFVNQYVDLEDTGLDYSQAIRSAWAE